jgi:hypothetical protein
MTAMKVAASENSAMRRDQMASREIDVSVNGCRRIEGQNSLFTRAALRPKSLAGQKKCEERIKHTVELFDEPGGDFRHNLKGRGPFGRWRCCSSLMIV